MGIPEEIHVEKAAKIYPASPEIEISALTGSAMVRLLRIQHGRLVDKEIYSAFQIDLGYANLKLKSANYLVAGRDGQTVGAIGYTYDAHSQSLRIIELLAADEAVKGTLLRYVTAHATAEMKAEIVECDVSAGSPNMQQSMLELGFMPVAYVPGMVFHQTHRDDVVKMMKLNIPWELGPLKLTGPSEEYYQTIRKVFEDE
jgi:hypothetical protein